jgi:endo-1,4-beta-xylanase
MSFGAGGRINSMGGNGMGGASMGGKAAGMGGASMGGASMGGKAAGMGGASMGGKAAGMGGASMGMGGNTTGPITSTCTAASKTVTGNGTGTHCDYTYEYWKDAGNGTLTLKADGFSLDWSSVNDLLGRKGRRPGSADIIVDYEANYQPNGNSYLCIYGWTKNPLVEYYIVDSWGNWRPPGGEGHVSTTTSDGGTYDLYKISRNGANIQGNGAFTQYWSVRTAKKTSGTITVANHFNAWKSNGMQMGSFYEVSMTVEGYQSSGKADVKFTMR